MNNFIKQLEIKNFKSIKHLPKTECKRVNVFIGKPNVGKSNILEAIGILGAQYSRNTKKFLSEFIRYEEISNLFYDEDLLNKIEVNSNLANAIIRFHTNNINKAELLISNSMVADYILPSSASSLQNGYSMFKEIVEQKEQYFKNDKMYPFYVIINPDGSQNIAPYTIEDNSFSPIKKYNFKDSNLGSNKFPDYLLPPHGDNLFTIIDQNKELRKEIADIFSEYGLNFVGYKKENKFEIEKSIDGYVTKYHYSSIADTFQRLIFYFAALDSNKNSVLILEEPEVHSFPPYTQELSERIIAAKDNQFFITTHSPYLLQNLISNLDSSELNIFVTYFENYETKIKMLSDNELRMASEFSVDLFYRLDDFVSHE